MAYKITDLDGQITPQDSDYIYSQIKDDDGSGNGTTMNVKAFGDMFQFFQRLMDKGGVTPKSLPDNAYNGWQLFEAFQNLLSNGTKIAFSFLNSYSSSGTPFYRKDAFGNVFLSGNFASPSSISAQIIAQLPAGYRPNQIRSLVAVGPSAAYQLVIDTSGNIFAQAFGGGNIPTSNTFRLDVMFNIVD